MIADIKKTAEQKMAQVGRGAEGTTSARCAPAAPTPGCSTTSTSTTTARRCRSTRCANVTLADARTIGVQPWEKKMVPVIEKAIRDSDLGLNPATSGDVIRVPMPRADRGAPPRADQGRAARGRGRARRGAQHPPRRQRAPEEAAEGQAVSEDDERRAQDEVQKLTDRFIAEIDKVLQAKEADLMAV